MTVVERYIFPLSFAQQRLWFIDQWASGSPFYNIPAALRLHGYLDVIALERGISEIVRRHETLRTMFTTKENQSVQVVTVASPDNLQNWLHPIVDLRNLSDDKQEQTVHQLLSAQMHQPFDLSCGPLLRTMLLRLKEQEHVFSLTIHHIISDAWSMGVLFNELSSLYTAFVEHKRSPLPELTLQYADYTIWQRERLQGAYQRELLDYWQKQLSGAPELLEMPLDRPRPAAQTFQGAVQRFVVPSSLADSLRALSRSAEVTLFMTLLAAFQVLLARYSGQQDIVVGTAIANRPQSELERLIGLFVNVLALRLDVSGQPTFLEVLSRVRQVVLGAFAHEDLPFEKVVEAVAPRRNMTYSPVFQALFTLHNTPGSSFVLPGITTSFIPTDQKTAQFDLSLELTEAPQGLVGFVEYNADIFDQTTIERMIVHFQVLLQGIVAQPEQRIQFLPLLTATERYQLLIEWNETKVGYDAPQSLHQLVEAQVARTPDAIALVFEDSCLSYQRLDQLANQLAQYLRSRLTSEHELIGICLHRSLDRLIGLLAILKAGCAYLPLDPDYPPHRLAFMLQQSQVPLLLTQQHLLSCLPDDQATSVLCLEALHPLLPGWPDTPPSCTVLPEQLAYVIYTSGSTGTPNGAMLSHRGLGNRLLWMQHVYQLSPADRVLQKTPSSFDLSVWGLFWPLLRAASLALAPP